MRLKKVLSLLFVVVLVLGVVAYLAFDFLSKPSTKKTNEQAINQSAIETIKSLNLTDNFCFAVFGEKRDDNKSFENVLDSIHNDNEISFIVNNGGFTSQGYTYQYREFVRLIDGFSKPVISVFGNHDAKHDGLLNFNKYFGREFYDLSINNVAFIVLNMSDINGNSFSGRQRKWLSGAFDKYQNSGFKFVFLNVPFFGEKMKGSFNKDLASYLTDIFNEKNVSYLFASYLDEYSKGTLRGVPFIITGMVLNPEMSEKSHYIKVCLKGQDLKTEVVNVD